MLKPFFVWQQKALRKIDPADVMCLYTEGNYTKIFLSDKTYYLVRSTLSGALKKLPPEIFIKTHRAFAVSVNFMDNVTKDHLTVRDESIPIAKQYYARVIRQLTIIE
ncbi:MAG: LytTR family DNA-binding domain-containing protein [Flavitalea sp.]